MRLSRCTLAATVVHELARDAPEWVGEAPAVEPARRSHPATLD
ncbi:MAG: hypothetical protein U5K74_05625 [Gemmatimonadaceae bacterium]|nr:hypothetical protein [Gemmatimonadaceae bacterium]